MLTRLKGHLFKRWIEAKRCAVKAGLGEEALEEARLVLHSPQPCLDQRGQLADVVLDEVGQRPFQARPVLTSLDPDYLPNSDILLISTKDPSSDANMFKARHERSPIGYNRTCRNFGAVNAGVKFLGYAYAAASK
jgi:hypothetical protein